MMLNNAIVLILGITIVTAVDYCDKSICYPLTVHVECNNPLSKGGFGIACGSNPEIVPMTPELQEKILDTHNKLRNRQAKGETPGYDAAARMGTVHWDNDLAKFAETRARECLGFHDQCRSTEQYPFAGQNVYKLPRPISTDIQLVENAVNAWVEDEYGNGKRYGYMDFIKSFKHPPIYQLSHGVRHFTQVVRDKSLAVGCAMSKHRKWNGFIEVFVICDYSVSNIDGDPVYVPGPTASQCKTGTNPKYPGLCSENEEYELPKRFW